MEIDQSHRLMVRRKCSDRIKPVSYLGIGISLGAHLLEPRRSIQMKNGKCPDVLAFAGSTAIALGWTHSCVTGEVVGDKAVRFQPVRDPCRLISVRSGVLGDRLSGCVLQRVLV